MATSVPSRVPEGAPGSWLLAALLALGVGLGAAMGHRGTSPLPQGIDHRTVATKSPAAESAPASPSEVAPSTTPSTEGTLAAPATSPLVAAPGALDAAHEDHWEQALAARSEAEVAAAVARFLAVASPQAGPQPSEAHRSTRRLVTGTVRTEDGAPLAGARVFAAPDVDPWRADFIGRARLMSARDGRRHGLLGAALVLRRTLPATHEAVSGPDGIFAVEVPAEAYVLSAVADGYLLEAARADSGPASGGADDFSSDPLEAAIPDRPSTSFIARPARRVVMRTVDDRGARRASGVSIAEGPSWYDRRVERAPLLRMGEHVVHSLGRWPGRETLVVAPEGPTPAAAIVVASGAAPEAEADDFAAEEEDEVSPPSGPGERAPARPGAVFAVRVLSSEGEPVDNVRVVIDAPDPKPGERLPGAHTDGSGWARVVLPEGAPAPLAGDAILLQRFDSFAERAPLLVTRPGRGEARLRPTGVVRVTVPEGTLAAMGGAAVVTLDAAQHESGQEPHEARRAALVTSGGAVWLGPVPEGAYVLRLSQPAPGRPDVSRDLPVLAARRISIRAGASAETIGIEGVRDVALLLPGPGRVALATLPESGDGAPPPARTERVDDGGRLLLRGLPAAPFVVGFAAEGAVASLDGVLLLAADAAGDVTFAPGAMPGSALLLACPPSTYLDVNPGNLAVPRLRSGDLVVALDGAPPADPLDAFAGDPVRPLRLQVRRGAETFAVETTRRLIRKALRDEREALFVPFPLR